MIRQKIEIELFNYNELNKKAKEKAFNEYFEFLCTIQDELITKEILDSVENSILDNGYLFFKDGTLANCTHYTGEHPKKEQQSLNFKIKFIF